MGGAGEMKLLYDKNLLNRLVALLAGEFPGSVHVRDLGLATATDTSVWTYAEANGFVIISKDIDFQQRAMLFGHPPKIIWIRLGNCSTARIVTLLRSRLTDIQAFEFDPVASLLASLLALS